MISQLRTAVTLPKTFTVASVLYLADPLGPSVISQRAYLAGDMTPTADAALFRRHPMVVDATSDCYSAPPNTASPMERIAVDVMVFNNSSDAVAVSDAFRSEFAHGVEGLPRGLPSDTSLAGATHAWRVLANNQLHVMDVIAGVRNHMLIQVLADHPPVPAGPAVTLPDAGPAMQRVWIWLMSQLRSRAGT